MRTHLTMAEHIKLRDPLVAALDHHVHIATRGADSDRAEAIRLALADEAYRWAARQLDDLFPPPPLEEAPPVGALIGVGGGGVAPACSDAPGRDDLCFSCWSPAVLRRD